MSDWLAPAVMSASVAEPVRVTGLATPTFDWSSPALTTGARLARTFTTTVSLAVPPKLSVAVRRNVRVWADADTGTLKVALRSVVLDKVTAAPPVCSHR